MEVTFDPDKDALNIEAHGMSLKAAEDFDFTSAYLQVDDREDYGEVRYRAISFLNAWLVVLVFTETPKGIRAISLRKAERKEMREYAVEN